MIEAAGLEEWLAGIRKDLIDEDVSDPQPVRRVMIPKPGGNGERPLGIPTIRDRVVQTAAKLVLEPIFEADLDPSCLWLPPEAGRHRRGQGGASTALPRLHRCGRRRSVQVLRHDPAPRTDAVQSLGADRRSACPAPDQDVAQDTGRGNGSAMGERRMSGGKHSTCGTPQGGVISPMLANVYMNRFLRYWRHQGRGEALSSPCRDLRR